MLIDTSAKHKAHSVSPWPAQEVMPKVTMPPLRIRLDKENFGKTNPDIGISAERMTPKGRHRVTANVCVHCLATRREYRAKVRQFMRLALSDMCIENPEALSLLMAAPKGHS